MRQAIVSIALIFVGGVFGFFMGGTLAANMVTSHDVTAAATVAFSAIGTGILGAGIGLFVSTRRKD